ncbi:AraC family transcriptional regulator [Herbaspirillum frisingense]|uniref:AraC family transcriptional regulator n=1 Tax=Herbaspirillum frisingense TaxID=92645 RepID=UPI0016029F02|nr:AraC family transcriptional regulator [Herbaspirillum frisingense]QNB09450.1 AraC family transcriptional regulator [Herbaspirillum frisingense]
MNLCAPAPLDLSRLYQACVFRSDERVVSHDQVSQALSSHQLQWQQGAVDAALYKVRVRHLQLFALRYGAQVEVRPDAFDGFSLVHMGVRGVVEFEVDGRPIRVLPGTAALISPRRDVRMKWSEGAEQLILKVPHHLLGAGPTGFASQLLPAQSQPQWELLLHTLLGVAALPGPCAQDDWVAHLEQGAVSFLRGLRPDGDNAATASPEPARSVEVCHRKRLDMLDRYLQQHLADNISRADMAAASRVSLRTLSALCQRYYGVAPMTLLRNRRLDAAHAALLRADHAGVTEAAIRVGFSHLGRFSHYYRQRFGVPPSKTEEGARNRRARNG